MLLPQLLVQPWPFAPLFWELVEVNPKRVEELLEVEKSRREGGVAVGERDRDDEEFGRGEGEKSA